MGGTNQGTPRSRTLGARLLAARTAAGLTVRQLAERLEINHSTLVRYEGGTRSPKPEVVATIAGALGLNGAEREELLELARGADDRTWLAVSMPEQQRQLAALLAFERTATRITDVSMLLLPGLLQTSDYARAIMIAAEVPDTQIDTRVAVRVGRRDALTRKNPAHLTAVIWEPVLREMIGGPQVMADCLRYLETVADWPNVDLRVIPGDAGWHHALEGSFVLDHFEDEPAVVHLETRASGLFLHEKEDVAVYEEAAEKVLRVAMSAADSKALIAREAKRIEETIA